MTASAPQVVQLTCPNCRTPMRAQIITLIDVDRQPQLKNMLLAGQLNIAVCPTCGNPAMLAAPLIYHDGTKQLCFVHFPQQLNARKDEEERYIGDATSAIMRALPPNAPRGYLLAPRRFLTINALIDAVLEADGISRETIEQQRAHVELISLLAYAYDQGGDLLAQTVAQVRPALDDAFFTTLATFADASVQASRPDSSELLIELRDALLELLALPEGELPEGAGGEEEEVDLDALVKQLVAAPEAELDAIIQEARPSIDYGLLARWTERIDAAEQADDRELADRLTERRSLVLASVERMDREAQELFERAAALARSAIESDDPEAVLRGDVAGLNDAFFLVLQSNGEAAERAGRGDVAERLMQLGDLAQRVIEDSLTPEDRFINQLMAVEKPQQATQLLREQFAAITPALIKRLNELSAEMEAASRADEATRLKQLAREAGAMLF